MDQFKHFFKCVKPSDEKTDSSDENGMDNPHEDSVTDQSKKKEFYIQFEAHYKQQHLAALAESQAIFEKQRQFVEKKFQDINFKLKQFEQLQNYAKQIEVNAQTNKSEKLFEVRDSEWVKFE